MKKLLIPFVLLLIQIPLEAQILKRIEQSAKRATERVIERKTEEKVEDEVENIFDSIFTSKKENKKDTTSQGSEEAVTENTEQASFNIFGSDAKYEDSYSFDISFTIQIEDYEEDSYAMEITQGYGTDCLLTITEETEAPIIMDFKNNTALMVNEKEKQIQAFSLKGMDKYMKNSAEEINTEEFPDVDIVKTGKTKKILGYTCYEYIMDSKDGRMVSWHAPDVTFDYSKMFGSFTDFPEMNKGVQTENLIEMQEGYLMEMTMFKPNGKKQTYYKVISIDENERIINLEKFTVQKF